MTFGNEEQIAENLGRIKNPTLWTKATSFIVYLPESRFWSVIGLVLNVEFKVHDVLVPAASTREPQLHFPRARLDDDGHGHCWLDDNDAGSRDSAAQENG